MGALGLVHRFSEPLPLDGAQARRWIGGKGASLAEMTRMGLPVPPGFTLSTEVWKHAVETGALPDGLEARLREEVARLEEAVGARFGDPDQPLLLAVRSGGPTSMPGMLDTVLDVGVNGAVARGLSQRYGQPRFGRDVRRRFLESYATVVRGVPRDAFDALAGRRQIHALDENALDALLVEYERMIAHEVGEPIPDDPWAQLRGAIEGVIRSWSAPRAQKYREAHGIPDDEGTGVTVQAMVFGNLGAGSGSGVVFTRNPSTGDKALFGEWLPDAQGEDVVGGRRTPRPLTRAQIRRGMEDDSLESAMPETFATLTELAARLEERHGDAQDVEITIERGALWVLQSRSAKRSARAAARIAVEMHEEGTLGRREALSRIEPSSLRQLLTPRLPDPQQLAEQGLSPVARGLAASPGAATGQIVFDAEAAQRAAAGEELILVRAETSAEDVETMRMVHGILTAAGGLTSHAAVVARAIGKPCVTGATSLHVDYGRRTVVARSPQFAGLELPEGSVITIDGARGLVYAAAVPVEPAPASPHVETLLAWADEARVARVWARASSPRLAQVGRSFGADGIAVTDCLDVAGLVEAAGSLPIALRIDDEGQLGGLADGLRAGLDCVVVRPALMERAREVGVAVYAWVDPGTLVDADGLWIDLDGPGAVDALCAAELRPEMPVLLHGDAATHPEVLGWCLGRQEVGAIVPPLDVPVGRLQTARAASLS